MEIIEFNASYENQVKDLLVELQQYIIKIDKLKLNILSKDYVMNILQTLISKCIQTMEKSF